MEDNAVFEEQSGSFPCVDCDKFLAYFEDCARTKENCVLYLVNNNKCPYEMKHNMSEKQFKTEYLCEFVSEDIS